MSIAGHVSQRMLSHYSHVRIEAGRKALDALAEGTKSKGYVTKQWKKPSLIRNLLKGVAEREGFTGALILKDPQYRPRTLTHPDGLFYITRR